jgi:hypothetical protein
MRILFDQGTPMPIRPYLRGHLVRTAAQEGWDRLRNGHLLDAAERAGFDLLLTTHKNLRYQQNLTSRRRGIILLGVGQWPDLRPHVQRVIDAVDEAMPGCYVEIDIPLS